MIDIHKILNKHFYHTQQTQKSHPVSRVFERGWTLVELAIVLAIIGLLIGGMLRGDELYRQVKVRRLMSDINSVTAAIKGFQDRYGSIPGDYPLATKRVPNCNSVASPPYCDDGNGDSRIGRTFSGLPGCGGSWGSGWDKDQAGSAAKGPCWYGETTQFWKHLALAGFLRGVNPYSNPTKPEWFQTHPGTPIGGGFTIFTDTLSAGSSTSIRFQNDPAYAGGVGGQAVDDPYERPFTINQAKYMDQKYDDGIAAAGYIWGIPYAGPGYDPACRTGASGGYNVAASGNDRLCQQHFILH